MRTAFLLFLAFAAPAAADELPLNPAVTQETIAGTICKPGWTKTVRPSARYTNRIKFELIQREELPEELLVDFELDHRIPLALGGAPSDTSNCHGTKRRRRIKSRRAWRARCALAESLSTRPGGAYGRTGTRPGRRARSEGRRISGPFPPP